MGVNWRDLRPCPCGGKAELVVTLDEHPAGAGLYVILCERCDDLAAGAHPPRDEPEHAAADWNLDIERYGFNT